MIRIFGSTLNSNTDFSSNGLGVLSEAISCIVTEELNGGYELELTYPVTGVHSSYLALRNIIVAKPNPFSNYQPFRIYSVSKEIDGSITVNAQHISYDLNGYVAQVLNNPVNGLKEYFDRLSTITKPTGCPFTFETTTNSSSEFKVKDILPIRTILGNSSSYTPKEEDPSGRIVQEEFTGYVLDIFPGEYEWDGLKVKHYQLVDGIGGRGSNRGVSIRYGKNLTSFKQDTNCQKVYTGIYPYWHYDGYRHDLVELEASTTWSDDKSHKDANDPIVYLAGTYDFSNILPLDLTSAFPRRPSDDDMKTYLLDYIKKNDLSTPEVSFDVSFIPLSQTEEYKDYAILETVRLADTVTVVFPLMGVSASAKVTKTEYDAIANKYTTITLGSYKNGVADTMAAQSVSVKERITTTELESAVVAATERLTGQTGGYVVMNTTGSSSDNGVPNEILIMDSPSAIDARNVWRWNVDGLGFSPNGIDGPYTTAITSDGQIVADFITAGYISGERIKVGTITADQISVDYTNGIRQEFQAADGELLSRITDLAGLTDANTQLISSIQQTAEALNVKFEEQAVSGINKIQNSSGLNGLKNWTNTGTASVVTQDGSDSGKGFKLVSGSLKQTFAVNKGESYSVSLRYINTTSSGSYVHINGVSGATDNIKVLEIDSNVTSLTLLYDSFVANSSTAVVEIVSSGDALIVADLMVAPGESRHNWTPAPNEIYTTNVKVDKDGINITNSSSDTETIIDNEQFAVKYQDEVVLTVNKDATELQKTTVKQALTIGDDSETASSLYGKVRFIPVEGGVDLIML